jgi:cyclophilin family peptidyl-prolyl cis-trans isomerase
MSRRHLLVAVLAMLTLGVAGVAEEAKKKNPVYVLETSLGAVTIELDAEKAPITAKNFEEYAKAKHYDGLIFHRVIPGFMIQGGGMDAEMKERNTREPIKNEAKNGLKNLRGTLAMARTSDPDSATSQFFINVKDNDFLNHKDDASFGYAVFGKVLSGMDVVDKIVKTPTQTKGPHDDVPVTAVVIKSVKLKP